MSDPDFLTDIQAVRTSLLRLRDSDELFDPDELHGDRENSGEHAHRVPVRRALVDELIGFLDAREDIVDLQVRNGLDPFKLLLGHEPGTQESLD